VLSRRAAGFLLGVSAWTAFIWITLIKNIAKDHDHGLGFHVVHYVLAAISLTLTAIQARIAWTARPRPSLTKKAATDEAAAPTSSSAH
jgi:hypothetical protein